LAVSTRVLGACISEVKNMGNLGTLGIFFAGFFGGLSVFLAACGLLWWCSLYQKINLPK
jgi:hypothetical protein